MLHLKLENVPGKEDKQTVCKLSKVTNVFRQHVVIVNIFPFSSGSHKHPLFDNKPNHSPVVASSQATHRCLIKPQNAVELDTETHKYEKEAVPNKTALCVNGVRPQLQMINKSRRPVIPARAEEYFRF